MFSRLLILVLFVSLVFAMSCSDDDNPVQPNPSDDDIPPAAVIDLAAGEPTGTTLVLSWTAPGDDGNVAEARRYDIRYATVAITASNWEQATLVLNPPDPTVGGQPESYTVTGLAPLTTYYFALKTADEVPNWSELSNVASARTDLAGNWVIYTSADSDLPSDNISDIAFASAAQRWIATADGLAYLDGTIWETYDTADGLVSNDLSAVAVDGGDDVWVGSHFDGVSRFDGSGFVNYTDTNSGLTAEAISDIAIGDGEYWFGTAGGLFHFDGTNWTNYNVSNSGLVSNAIDALALDAGGNLWIGYNLSGASRFDGVNFEHFDASDGFTSAAVADIEVHDNNIWFATEVGAFVYDGSGWTSYSSSNSDLPSYVILAVAVGIDGDRWFATAGGLTRFDGTTWTTYRTDNSALPDNTIRVIEVDMVGHIWIGTLGGLAMFYD
ncbi:MAG: fibronectin type III domain-containing protein [Candidatus Zixiibacteriota bacterium]|nr:MAG: fibronectin type III domain-containing protein [candidate division Zixibacteria bacterium]